MKKLSIFCLLAISTVIFGSCENRATNNTATSNANGAASNANANAAKPAAAAPTKETLLALENKALEAFKTNNAQFWEGFIADGYVGFMNGHRTSKADEVKMLGEMKCEVKSATISEEAVTPIGPDAAVITSRFTTDGTCGGEKIPSPTRSASLYVRSGDTWKAAYHNETPIVDPKAPPSAMPPAPSAKKDEAKKEAAKPDALTEALMAVESRGWNAWKSKDAGAFGEILYKDFGFVDPMGGFVSSRADAIKMWTEHKCEIKSAGPVDGMATNVLPNVAILTFRGNADGTCGDEKLKNVWGTTIAVKDGDAWKAAYVFEAPAM